MKHAVINKSLKVINIIQWDGKSPWKPPMGTTAVPSDIAEIGDSYDPRSRMFFKEAEKLTPDSKK